MQTTLDKHSLQTVIRNHIDSCARPLICLLGPTASGKTVLSIELAKLFDAEVVNADSRQLYRGFDIGTAKITTEEMQGVPHHLLDVLNPKEEATAGWYQQEAEQIIEQVLDAGSVPLLVGGSMLYIATITDGLTLVPMHDPHLRKTLMQQYDADKGETLYAKLLEYDPETAERVHRNNKERLVRAVEVCELVRAGYDLPKGQLRSDQATCKYDLLMIGLHKPRNEIVVSINNRVTAMMDAGWITEVQRLLDQGYTADDPGMKSHGYREIIRYLYDEKPVSPQELEEQIAAKTRQYAKRQMTWWKPDARIQWVDLSC